MIRKLWEKAKDLILYLIVGGTAAIVEWILFYVFTTYLNFYYLLATVTAYIFSTFSNWLAGRLIMFKKSEKGLFFELISIYGASVIGLLLNLIIMWIAVDALHINSMISKVIATGLVFVWNFLIRKFVIYRK